MDPSAFSASLVGVLVPFLVHLVRRHVFQWTDKAAHTLALVIAALAVTGAYFFQAGPHTWSGWIGNFGAAYTLSQVVYRSVKDSLPGLSEESEDDSDGPGPASFPPLAPV